MIRLVKLVALLIASLSVSQSNGQLQDTGICSWYGAVGEIPEGWITACEVPFSRHLLATAHPTLPCGTHIKVTNLNKNGTNYGETVNVVVNDRGPFVPGRILDLTATAFAKIEDLGVGIIPCAYTVIHPFQIFMLTQFPDYYYPN